MIIKDPPPPRRQAPPAEDCSPVFTGTVHRYFADVKLGSIKSDKGGLYSFHASDWLSAKILPASAMRVFFELDDIRAVRIQAEEYLEQSA